MIFESNITYRKFLYWIVHSSHSIYIPYTFYFSVLCDDSSRNSIKAVFFFFPVLTLFVRHYNQNKMDILTMACFMHRRLVRQEISAVKKKGARERKKKISGRARVLKSSFRQNPSSATDFWIYLKRSETGQSTRRYEWYTFERNLRIKASYLYEFIHCLPPQYVK